MRVTVLPLAVAAVCTGCLSCQRPAEQDATPAPARPSEREGHDHVEGPPAPPAMTAREIHALVESTVAKVVAEEFARRDQQAGAEQADDKARHKQLLEEVRSAAVAAVKAELKAQQQARDQAEQSAADATHRAEQADKAIARFLLSPQELERVDKLQQKLQTEDIWSLSEQDLRFASIGLAAPLLHDALFAAAKRYDANIEMDVLARKAELTPEEKIQMAGMPPIQREQLLSFAEQFDNERPSITGDRFIREYIYRYPFIRKILIAYLGEEQASQ